MWMTSLSIGVSFLIKMDVSRFKILLFKMFVDNQRAGCRVNVTLHFCATQPSEQSWVIYTCIRILAFRFRIVANYSDTNTFLLIRIPMHLNIFIFMRIILEYIFIVRGSTYVLCMRVY